MNDPFDPNAYGSGRNDNTQPKGEPQKTTDSEFFNSGSFGGNPYYNRPTTQPKGGNPYTQSPYGASPKGDNPYTQSPYGASPKADQPEVTPPDSTPPAGGQPDGSAPYGRNPYNGQPYDRPYGAQPTGGQPYGGQPYGGQPYGAQPTGGQPYGGQPYGNPNYQQVGEQPGHNLAIASLVCAIAAFLFCGIFTSIPAIVCAIKAKKQGNTEAINIIGLIGGIIITLLYAFFIVIIVFAIALTISEGVSEDIYLTIGHWLLK